MDDFSLMRGPDWVRCCICGELHRHPYRNLAREPSEVPGITYIVDVCAGECAEEAGLPVEPFPTTNNHERETQRHDP